MSKYAQYEDCIYSVIYIPYIDKALPINLLICIQNLCLYVSWNLSLLILINRQGLLLCDALWWVGRVLWPIVLCLPLKIQPVEMQESPCTFVGNFSFYSNILDRNLCKTFEKNEINLSNRGLLHLGESLLTLHRTDCVGLCLSQSSVEGWWNHRQTINVCERTRDVVLFDVVAAIRAIFYLRWWCDFF